MLRVSGAIVITILGAASLRAQARPTSPDTTRPAPPAKPAVRKIPPPAGMVILTRAQYDSVVQARRRAKAASERGNAAQTTTESTPSMSTRHKSAPTKPAKVRPDTGS
jgi:hypothetical protein